jgi:hypothetical protein
MTTLSSSRVVRVLDRLFAEADASEQAMGAAVAGTDVSAMITSRTRYREYYGLLKEIPLPVSRETGALLYMLVRATRAQICAPSMGALLRVQVPSQAGHSE